MPFCDLLATHDVEGTVPMKHNQRPYAVLFSAMLVLAGCAAGSESSSGSGGDQGAGGDKGDGNRGGSSAGSGAGGVADPMGASDAGVGSGSGGSAASGGSGGSSGKNCPIQIGGLSVTSLSRVVAGPQATVTVQARLDSGLMDAPKAYKWSVLFGAQTIVTKTTTTNELTFPVATAGTYTVELSATLGATDCKVNKTVLAVSQNERSTDLWMRVLPAAKSELTPYEHWLSLTPNASAPTPTINLYPTSKVTIAPKHTSQSGASLVYPSFVRLTSKVCTFRWENHTVDQNGVVLGYMAQLDPQYAYDVLVVPDRDLFAPFMMKGLTIEALKSKTITIETGTTVKGQVSSKAGIVANARILLRNADIPSTLGTTDATGGFTLLSSEGTFGAFIRAADNSDLPDLTLPEANGIVIPRNGTLSNVKVIWKDLPLADVSIRIDSPYNKGSVEGTEVKLENTTSFANAGTLSVTGTPDRNLLGKIVRRMVTDATGTVSFANLPRGNYEATLLPPRATGFARTSSSLVVDQPSVTASLRLASNVKINGILQPAAGAAGAVLQAYDVDAPTEAPVVATVGNDGSYVLSVPPYRTYRVRVIPTMTSGFPVAPLATVGVQGADMTMPPRNIPSATRIKGNVTGTTGAVAGSIVQIFCLGNDKDCICPQQASSSACPADANLVTAVPLAEVFTDANGRFSLLAVDPASL